MVRDRDDDRRSSMRHRLLAALLGSLLGAAAPAGAADPEAALRLAERVAPGGLLIGRAAPGSQVSVDGRAVRVSADGRFVFGVGRDAAGQVEVEVRPPAGDTVSKSVGIEKRDYQIQRIDGLPPRQVEPNADDRTRIEADWIMLSKAKSEDSAGLAFAGAAAWPVLGPISGVFGSQRILNGKAKSPHAGVDVAAPEGTPVGAMLEGVVTVAARDMYYTGGTVMVDHGHGIQSLYAHLASVDVTVGQTLQKGEQLGTIGATGRATGPHLHLSLYWFDTALDPALLLGAMPEHRPMPRPQQAAAGTQ
jgi:hypothetical protein